MTGPKTRFVQLCAEMEGYGKPDAIPTIDNNPMDLRHSPHSQHSPGAPNAIGKIDFIVNGWADAERQAELWAERGLTLAQAIQEQTGWTAEAGDVDGNHMQEYLSFVALGLGMEESTPMVEVLRVPAV